MINFFKKQNGQIMIISVLALGGALLTSASIAGLLMVYQIRAGNDAVNSARAIFAADAGIEAASWCYFKGVLCDPVVTAENINFSVSGISIEATSTVTVDSISVIAYGFASNGKIVRVLETILAKQ